MIYRFMTWLMRFLTKSFLVGGLFTVKGRENVPPTGALLVCANHAGTLDPPMVPGFTPRLDAWTMAKSEYFRTPAAPIFRWYHAFPVVRHSADRAALKRSFDLLRDGHALIIFPEGTRTPSGKLEKPEPGAGFIAQKSGSAVVPVALVGTREAMPKGSWLPKRGRVSVTFGTPFRVAMKKPDGTRVGHQDASDAIMLRIAELLPPDMRGEFSDLEGQRKRLEGVTSPV